MKQSGLEQPLLSGVELAIIDLQAVQEYPHFRSDRRPVLDKLSQAVTAQFAAVECPQATPGWVDRARQSNFDPDATISDANQLGAWEETIREEYGSVTNRTVAQMARTYVEEVELPFSQEAPEFTPSENSIIRSALRWCAATASDPSVRRAARLARHRYVAGQRGLIDRLVDGPFGDRKIVRALASILS